MQYVPLRKPEYLAVSCNLLDFGSVCPAALLAFKCDHRVSVFLFERVVSVER